MAALFLLALPASAEAQTYSTGTATDLSMGTAIIMGAGSKADAVRRLKAVPSVGVVDLNARRLRVFDDGGYADRVEYRISAARNAKGIARLRAALRANP